MAGCWRKTSSEDCHGLVHAFTFRFVAQAASSFACIAVLPIALAGTNPPATEPAAAPAPVTQLEAVNVSGVDDLGDRRESPVARFVLTSEEISRFGDTSLADVLGRVPGVSIGDGAGRSREIRMRGLGGGYTQVLINGEPVASGFSVDSISPDLIDRIEVLRSPTADQSAQSIAGSINIVLKQVVRAGTREVKTNVSTYEGLLSGGASGQYANRRGSLSYTLAGNVNVDRDRWPSTTYLRAVDSSGSLVSERETRSVEEGRRLTFGLTPRLTIKSREEQSLSLDGFFQGQQFTHTGEESRTVHGGESPDFASNVMRVIYDSLLARVTAALKSPIGDEGRIDTRIILATNRRDSDGRLSGFDEQGGAVLFRTVDSSLEDDSVTWTGKYNISIGRSHSFAVGFDSQYTSRDEGRVQRETSPVGFDTLDLDERYDARVARTAVYIQDEWTASPKVSGYVGLRWEDLKTDTRGTGVNNVGYRSSTLSPTAQLLLKLPSSKSKQVRVALSRTYKAPTARELIPRRWVVNDNSATTPNFQGNPELKPELAWGLEAGYEHYLGETTILALNAYKRRIDNVTIQRIYEEEGIWISTPDNSGRAQVLGLELELKGKLSDLLEGAPTVDVRSGVTRNWSRIDAVPGPDNRLDQQPSFTASLGADYTLRGLPLTIGSSFSYERPTEARTTLNQRVRTPGRRVLDTYGLWNISKSSRLRLSALNLLAPQKVTYSRYEDDTLTQDQSLLESTFRTIRLTLEMSL